MQTEQGGRSRGGLRPPLRGEPLTRLCRGRRHRPRPADGAPHKLQPPLTPSGRRHIRGRVHQNKNTIMLFILRTRERFDTMLAS